MDEETRTAVERAVGVLAAIPVGALTIDPLQTLVGTSLAAAARLAGIGSRALGELTERGNGLVPAGSTGSCPTDRRLVAGRRPAEWTPSRAAGPDRPRPS